MPQIIEAMFAIATGTDALIPLAGVALIAVLLLGGLLGAVGGGKRK
jgi:hypothetical protein